MESGKNFFLCLGFEEGVRIFWGYFCKFLGLFSAILRCFPLCFRYLILFHEIFLPYYAILHYFTLVFDSMTNYLTAGFKEALSLPRRLSCVLGGFEDSYTPQPLG